MSTKNIGRSILTTQGIIYVSNQMNSNTRQINLIFRGYLFNKTKISTYWLKLLSLRVIKTITQSICHTNTTIIGSRPTYAYDKISDARLNQMNN